MYSVFNNCAYINGLNGKYDSTVENYSARYGRNAIDNHMKYLSEYHHEPIQCDTFEMPKKPHLRDKDINGDMMKLYEKLVEYLNALTRNAKKAEEFNKKLEESADKMPPLNFELQYMPKSEKGYVDYDALFGASYEEMGQHYSISVDKMDKMLNPPEQGYLIPAKSLDINKDGEIDVPEYATSILLTDMLSTDSENVSADNVNGKITNKGENALLNRYYNGKMSGSMYAYLYDYFKLGEKEVHLF